MMRSGRIGIAALAPLAVALTMTSGCNSGAPVDNGAIGSNAANASVGSGVMPASDGGGADTSVASSGDPVAGKKSFGQCMACHSAEKGGKDMVGPHLAGIVGAKAGTHSPTFKYSAALKASNLTWDAATLDGWIEDPLKKVPGSNMHFLGVPRKATRDNIIAYLASTGA